MHRIPVRYGICLTFHCNYIVCRHLNTILISLRAFQHFAHFHCMHFLQETPVDPHIRDNMAHIRRFANEYASLRPVDQRALGNRIVRSGDERF